MSDPPTFVVTKQYRLTASFCDSCRDSRDVGLGSGPKATGKTESARHYAGWEMIEPFLPESWTTFSGRHVLDGLFPYKPFTFSSAQTPAPILDGRTVFYTAPVSSSPGRIERELMALFAAFAYLVETANQHHQARENLPLARRSSHLIELLIGDCANRLKEAGFDQIRDRDFRGRFGLISTSHARIGEACGTISSTLLAGRFCSSRSPFGRGRNALFSGPALSP